MLDRATVESAFGEMGEILSRQRIVGEIVVFGSIAMVLQYDVTTVSHDVDVRIDTHHSAVERAAHEVARRRGWLRSWFNEAVVQYLSTKQSIHLHRTYGGLRVYVARPEYLLAMKVNACRPHDLPHAILLARETGITTPIGLNELRRTFFPENDQRDERRNMFINDVVTTYQSKSIPPRI